MDKWNHGIDEAIYSPDNRKEHNITGTVDAKKCALMGIVKNN